MRLEIAEIFFACRDRVDEERTSRFQILEHGCRFETETQLGGIKNLKNNDFVAASRERGQLRFESVDRRQKVGKHDYEATFADDLDNSLEGTGKIGGLAAGRLLERKHQVAQMAGPMARGQKIANGFIEGEQADGVALQVKEVGESGRKSGGVFGF